MKALKLNEMAKSVTTIPKAAINKINAFNAELTQVMEYTGDKYCLLSADDDYYACSPLRIENNILFFTLDYNQTSGGIFNEQEELIKYDEWDDTYYFDTEAFKEIVGPLIKDLKRGLKDFKMFNPERDEDSEGNRKTEYYDRLNN